MMQGQKKLNEKHQCELKKNTHRTQQTITVYYRHTHTNL